MMVRSVVSLADFVPVNDNDTNLDNNREYSFINNKSIIENVTQDFNETIATTIALKTSTSGEEISKKSIFKNLMALFDGYTFILVLAFFSGLIIFMLLVCCALCACKSFNRRTSNSKTPITKITNPLYDSIEIKSIRNIEIDDPHRQIVSIDSPEKEKLINKDNVDDVFIEQNKDVHHKIDAHQNNSNNLNDSSLLNSISASCSTTSVNSVVQIKLKDSALPDKQTTPETKPIQKEPISPPSNLTSNPVLLPSSITNVNETPKKILKVEKSPVLDQIDITRSEEPETSGYKRFSKFTPSSLTKSTQQLLQEQKVAESKIPPAYRRTSSQSTPNDNNQEINRMSAASSRSSIPHAINFDIIKGDIDEWAGNKNNFVSRSNLASSSRSSSQNIDFELGDSIPDIYTKELIKKHEEISKKSKAQVKKNDTSLSSSSANSSFKGNKSKHSDRRRSMNIPITEISLDPNAQSNSEKLIKKNPDSVSNYTMESEKSCY